MTAVLDTSAVLALLYREPGHATVAGFLDGAVISAVNWSETLAKLTQRGLANHAPAHAVLALGVQVLPFTQDAAEQAARLWPVGRVCGLSLGARACLAVAQGQADGTAVTADSAWTELTIPDTTVQLIR